MIFFVIAYDDFAAFRAANVAEKNGGTVVSITAMPAEPNHDLAPPNPQRFMVWIRAGTRDQIDAAIDNDRTRHP